MPVVADPAAEVVHGLAIAGAKRKAVRVDAGEPGGVRAGAGRVGVTAEVVGVGLARLERACRRAGGRRCEESAPDPVEESPSRGLLSNELGEAAIRQGPPRGPDARPFRARSRAGAGC